MLPACSMRYALAVVLLVILPWAEAAAQLRVDWAVAITNLESTSYDTPRIWDTAVDRDGNLIVAGEAKGAIDLDGDEVANFITQGTTDLFVASYAPTGALNWAHRAGGTLSPPYTGYSAAWALSTDDAGHVYLAGLLSGIADLDEDGINDVMAPDSITIFVARLNLQGELDWIQPLPGNGWPMQLTYLHAPDAVVASYPTYDACHTREDRTACINENVFAGFTLEIRSATGDSLRAISSAQIPGDTLSHVVVDHLTTDRAGNLRMAGRIKGRVDLDGEGRGEPLIADVEDTHQPAPFVATLNAEGDVIKQHVLRAIQITPSLFVGHGIDQSGNTYLSGQLMPNPDSYGAVFKLGETGATLWSHTPTATDSPGFSAFMFDLTIDTMDNIYVAGQVQGAGDLDGDGMVDINHGTGTGALVARYSTDGKLDWVNSIPHDLFSGTTSTAEWVEAADSLTVYFGGTFIGEMDPDGEGPLPVLRTHHESNRSDPYVLRMTSASSVGIERPAPILPTIRLTAAPNPFRLTTRVSIRLEREDRVRVEVYDLLGRRVALIHEGVVPAGEHAFVLDGSRLRSGAYEVRVVGEKAMASTRVALAK